MKKAINFPGKYIQGEHVIKEIGPYLSDSDKVMILWGNHARQVAYDELIPSLESNNIEWIEEIYSGECTKKQGALFAEEARNNGCNVIIGIGGGKIMDLTKGVAAWSDSKSVIVPSVAASDAAISALTCWYTEDHVLDDNQPWPKSPDLVVADTTILITTPLRMFLAGIGDALATYIEARIAYANYANTAAGGKPTMAALAISKLSYDVIMRYGREAVENLKEGICTPAFDKIIEASILLSGLGWESCGTATAHTVGVRLSFHPDTHGKMHGEEVCFGIITQLFLDPDQDTKEREEIVKFMVDLGLPVTLEEVGLKDKSRDEIMQLASNIMENCKRGGIHNHSFESTPEDLCNAMLAADSYGKRMKGIQ